MEPESNESLKTPETAQIKEALLACYNGAHYDVTRFFPYLGPHTTQLVCLSIASAWVHRAFNKLPLLHLTGVKGSGKSTLIQIGVKHGLARHTMNPTAAVLFRTTANFLCIDECENLSQQLITILNASHQKGLRIERVGKVVDGVAGIDSFEPYKVTWMAGIKSRFPASLESRCIKINLKPIVSEHDSADLYAEDELWYTDLLRNYHRIAEVDVREAYVKQSCPKLKGRFKDCYRGLLSFSEWLGLPTKELYKHIVTQQQAETTDEDYTPDQVAILARLESKEVKGDELVLFGWIAEPLGGRIAYPRVRAALDGLGFNLRKKTDLGTHILIDRETLLLHLERSALA